MNHLNYNNKYKFNNNCKNKYKFNNICNSLKEVESFLCKSQKVISFAKISILLKKLFK